MQNVRVSDWNDIRYFLAVARTGSTLGAARALGVNQSTAARRVAALETAMGLKLFDRRQSGYALTEAGERLRPLAERMETEATGFFDRAGALARQETCVIRLTTPEGLANVVIAPALSDFRRLHPELRIDLLVDERRLDIVRGAADVALRTGAAPDEAGLVGRRLATIAWAAYCSRDYAERHGAPHDVEGLRGHPLVGAEGPLHALPGWVWLSGVAPDAEVTARSSSITNMVSAVKAGLGITILPCLLGDSEPELVRCLGPVEKIGSDLWLLTREELRDVPQVRAFMDFIAAYVTGKRALLAGRTPQPGAHAGPVG